MGIGTVRAAASLLPPATRAAWLVVPLALSAAACTVEGTPTDLRPPIDAGKSFDASSEAATDGGGEAADASVDAGQEAMADAPDAVADVQADAEPKGSCETATTLALQPVGETATVVVDLANAAAELTGTCGGSLFERVVRLEPADDATLLITAGGSGSFDPVLYVLAAECTYGSFADELSCQSGAPGVQVMVEVQEGISYFVVIDSDATSPSTTTTLSVLRLM